MKKTLILACALALAGVSNAALATEGGTGFVRAEVGSSHVEVDGFSGSDSDTSYSLRGGYYFNSYFAVEGFYSNLYDKDGAELSTFGAGVVGKKNLGANNSGFFFSGRAGIEHVKGDIDDGFGGFSDNSTQPYFGVGAGYDFNESFGLSLNYDFREADFDDLSIDVDTISLGGEFRF